jgi:predicted Zn-dependent peptidase
MPKPKTKTLPSGLRFLSIPMKDQRTVTVLVLVETGSKYETKEKNGISHFLEHMCFKGTTKRPSAMHITRELDGLGAEYNAFTGHEYTGYYAKVAAKHLPHALDVVADLYVDPLLNIEDIEREKGVIADEINMRADRLPTRVSELFMETLYGDQPAGWPIAGPKETIHTFTRENFVAYRSAQYVPQATTVVIAGSFDPVRAEKLVREKFAQVTEGKKGVKKKTVDRQSDPKAVVSFKESDQTHLVVGVRTFDLFHKSRATLNVLASVLGGGMSSRLFHRLREEMGVGYYVQAGNDTFTDHGFLAASTGVDNSRVNEVIRAILEEFARMKTELVSDEELNRVKEYIAGRMVLGLESSDELAEYYGFQEALRRETKTPEEILKEIRAVTPADLRALARKIFVPAHLNLALVGPYKDSTEFQKVLSV